MTISPSKVLTFLTYRVTSQGMDRMVYSLHKHFGICAKYTHFMDRTLTLKKQLVQQHFEPKVIDRKFWKWMIRSGKATVLKRYGRHIREIMSDLRGFQNKDQSTILTEAALVK